MRDVMRNIVVNGGSRGLGLGIARQLTMAGYRVIAIARKLNKNAVAPGFIETDMTQNLGDAQRGQIVRRSALQRLPDVEDVANAVEFLLGDKARNITGTVLTVDAGSTA
jgi:3-oxoacyl-[acyl-carrier protein] reductase